MTVGISSGVFVAAIQSYDDLDYPTYSWIDWIKILLLLSGWLAMFLIYQFPTLYISQLFIQIILALNIMIAGILALSYYELPCGLSLLILSFFTPKLTFDGELLIGSNDRSLIVNFCNSKNPVGDHSFLRLYFASLTSLHLFGGYFIEYTMIVSTVLTTIIPFVLLEFLPFKNINSPFHIFPARAFMLFWMVLLDCFAYPNFNQSLDFWDWKAFLQDSDYAVIWRNVLQLLTIAFIIGGCYLKDFLCAQNQDDPKRGVDTSEIQCMKK